MVKAPNMGSHRKTAHMQVIAEERLTRTRALNSKPACPVLPMALPAPIGSAARIRSSSVDIPEATLGQMLEDLGITTPPFWPYICQYHSRVLAVEQDSVKIPYEKPFER